MVEANNISKSYGAVRALDGVSLRVGKGEIFGIIGPDGAGKTTLFRILTTLILADGGRAAVGGFDVVEEYKEIRRRVGYMPGRFSLYQDLSVEENLAFFASVFGTTIADNYHLVEDIYKHIEPFRKRRAGKLSGGMKQKLALSCALIHKPEVLFLDEPTTGVDAVSRKEFWDMLGKLQRSGLTIVVSTPYMDEATLCDRIALIKGGRFMTTDTPEGILRGFGKTLWSACCSDMFRLLSDLRAWSMVDNCYVSGDRHHFTTLEGFDRERLVQYLADREHGEIEIEPIAPTIEDCYMELARK